MKRRNFIRTTLAASLVAANAGDAVIADPHQETKPEYYELRRYHLRRGKNTELMNDYFRDVAIPAMRRQGIDRIGVFNVMIGPDTPTMYVLIPHKTADSFATLDRRLATDAEYVRTGASFAALPSSSPAYVRMESSLMVAFDKMPRLEVTASAAGNKGRIFELRTYESHNERASKKKIEMFNRGEIAIFRRTGLQPVFFGETIAGARMPNLTYMLTYPDMATRDRNWKTFVDDPEWKKLSGLPEYADSEILSNISSVFLRPTNYSQI